MSMIRREIVASAARKAILADVSQDEFADAMRDLAETIYFEEMSSAAKSHIRAKKVQMIVDPAAET